MTKFGEHVTSTAFHLRLSRRMIEALCHIDHFGDCFCTMATWNALEGRGLIEKVPGKTAVKEDSGYMISAPGELKLTRAGELLIPLLKEAGLYTDFSWLTDLEETADIPEIKLTIRRKEKVEP